MQRISRAKGDVRGFAKLKKFQKSDKAHPTHPPPIKLFFGNPSLTWTEHSNHNKQQLIAFLDVFGVVYHDIVYSTQCHGILLQNISTGLGLFGTIFQKKKKIRARPGPTARVCVCVQNLTNFCPHALILTPNVPKILFA